MSRPDTTKWVAAAIVAITLFVFWSAAGHDFVNFDDDRYVTENPRVRAGLTLEGMAWAFTTTHVDNWHPLTWLSHMLDVEIFGVNPGAHHMVSVALHCVNAVLLFLVLKGMTGALWRSAAAAALFAVHPLHVESVAWLSERKDVLSAFFWIAVMGLHTGYARRGSTARYAALLALYALGLMAKPMLVSLPLVLLLLDYWPLARLGRPGVFREKVPLASLAAISSAVTFMVQSGARVPVEITPVQQRVGNAVISYAQYLYKTALPMKLSAFYPYRENAYPAWLVLAAAASLIAITVLAVSLRRRYPYLVVGWLWYLITLVPVIGLVRVGGQAFADRYTYLPLIGVFIMAAWVVQDLTKGIPRQRAVLAAASLAAILALAAVAKTQVGYWRNTSTLFGRALEVDDENWLAYNLLGYVLYMEGETEKATSYFRRATEINPSYDDAYNNLGLAMDLASDPNGAIASFRRALALNPDHTDAHINLGNSLSALGRYGEATVHYRSALEKDPGNAKAYLNLGINLAVQGKLKEGASYMNEALRLDPGNAEVHLNFGILRFQQGDYQGAAMNFQEALRINPDLETAKSYLRQVRMQTAK